MVSLGEGSRGPIGVPDLNGAAYELIAAGTFHAIDAHIGAADADCVFRRPGAGGIVFGGDKAMARIGGRGDWRSEIDIAETEDEITGFVTMR
jgi:hypothetical protein